MTDYAILVEPLEPEDGGGYLATVPDLPGCMSDGSTPQEAVTNVQGAVREWLDIQQARGVVPPLPGEARQAFGEWHQSLLDAFAAVERELDKQKRDNKVLEQKLATFQALMRDQSGRFRFGAEPREREATLSSGKAH